MYHHGNMHCSSTLVPVTTTIKIQETLCTGTEVGQVSETDLTLSYLFLEHVQCHAGTTELQSHVFEYPSTMHLIGRGQL